jgi:hypothetical protein
MSLFRQLRILFLLLVLFLVAMGTWLAELRTTDWDKPLVVVVYPVNGDGSDRAQNYIAALAEEDFRPIETFFSEEAAHYGLAIQQPVDFQLGPALEELPPESPADRNVLRVMWWSLTMRYWAWQVSRGAGPVADIQMFVVYHDPQSNPRLAHSLGLQKGLLGVVNAFASPREEGSNQVVIAHELLHTLGATDKYDLQTNQPLFPIGYAEPDRQPLFPQEIAEIMGGRIPLSEHRAVQAGSLAQVVIGKATALEIRWIE